MPLREKCHEINLLMNCSQEFRFPQWKVNLTPPSHILSFPCAHGEMGIYSGTSGKYRLCPKAELRADRMLNLRGFAWDAFYPAPGDSLRSTTPYTQAEAMPLWRTCGESSPLSKDTSRVCAQKARASSGVCQTLVVCERGPYVPSPLNGAVPG